MKIPRGIFKRKNRKSYYTRVYMGGRERTVALGTDLKDASRKMHELRTGGDRLPTRVTLQAATEMWLESYVAVNRDEKGQRLAKTRAHIYLLKYFGPVQLSKIAADHLRAYRLWLEKQSVSLQTVAHILSDARALFLWAEDTGLVDRSPMPRRLLPTIQETPARALSDQEASALAALPEPYGFVCRLAMGTGLRWSELCRAQASHVENAMLVISQTKSGRMRRVPLTDVLAQEIKLHIGALVPPEINNQAFTYAVRKLTGNKAFHIHRMRHTFATQWIARSGNLAALQQILGHASITTTQRYAKLTDDMVKAESQRLEAEA